MDMLEFTRQSNGMEDEYQKVLKRTADLIRYNGRDKKSLEIVHKQLDDERKNFSELLQTMMTRFSLEDRAIVEIRNRWNDKKWWGEE